jgi:biotin transport system permease protein/energy-coupling factor transport system permease protein
MIRFLPVILAQAKEIGDAQKARGIANRKNPVFRLKSLVIPLLRRTFERADDLTYAMAARGYVEHRTPMPFSATKTDWLVLLGVIGACLLCLR